MFKKKKSTKLGRLEMGVDIRRCASCRHYTRPCLVDGKPATFHRWVDEEQALLKINHFVRPEDMDQIVKRYREELIVGPGNSIEKRRACLALVEWPDGTVGTVDTKKLRFLDREV